MMEKSKQNKPKIVIILGPTATGKSDLAVKLSRKYNGEIISADSRQVYKGLDIGTGKITKKEMHGVPHHMLDVVSPKKVFTVVDWQRQTEKIIQDILKRGKLPIICGGTGFYIQSIVDGVVLPEVPSNFKLRKKLERKSLKELQLILKRLDPSRFKSIDTKNSVRLIRAIEIANKLSAVPKIKKQNRYSILQIGLTTRDLKLKIHNRLISHIKKGMIKEVENLHKKGLSWRRMRELGLEYRYLADYLEKKISKSELIKKLETEIWRYSKRQMTWFKRDKRITWFEFKQVEEIQKEINLFLN